jgi:hypothetical protein
MNKNIKAKVKAFIITALVAMATVAMTISAFASSGSGRG